MTAKRILVIDDEEGIRELIKMVLQAGGWEVLTAAGGEEGLMAAAAERPDAILLDMNMPDLDGGATLQKLQANGVTQNIPTMLLTASDDLAQQQGLIDLDIAGVIKKPFEAIYLEAQIRALLHW